MKQRKVVAGGGRVLALCAVLFAIVACDPTVQPQLTRYPYLTDLVGLSVTVNWATDTSGTTGSALWGAVDGSGACTPTQRRHREADEHHGGNDAGVPVGQHAHPPPVRPLLLSGQARLPGPPRDRWRPRRSSPRSLRARTSRTRSRCSATGARPTPTATTSTPVASWRSWRSPMPASWCRRVTTDIPRAARPTTATSSRRGADVSAIFGPAFWSFPGRSLPMFTSPGNHGMTLRRLDAQHRADQLAPGRRRRDVERPIRP